MLMTRDACAVVLLVLENGISTKERALTLIGVIGRISGCGLNKRSGEEDEWD